MKKHINVCALVLCSLAAASGTVSREAKNTAALALLGAAKLADARSSEQSFEISGVIKLEGGKADEGTYLLVWDSPDRWREEFSFPDFHQVRVSAPGGVWQKREPDFLSLRLWQLMQALAFYGRFELPREKSAGKVKLLKKEGTVLRCVEIKRNSYPVDELCFQQDVPQLVSEHYVPSDRWYEFTQYRKLKGKFFPGHIIVRESKTLAAEFSLSELGDVANATGTAFDLPAQAEWLPWCASPQSGGDPLSPIYSGLAQHKGTSTVYGAIGTDGQWHHVRILESAGAAHDREVVEGLEKERWKPSICNGTPIVVETVFRR